VSKNASVSSIIERAWLAQAVMHRPQPRQRSVIIAILSPEPSRQFFTGQTDMHEWQLLHLPVSIFMSGIILTYLLIVEIIDLYKHYPGA
jgi:hypothetical protein